MTNTMAATLLLYFQREATTRQLDAIDATLHNPTTDWHAGEVAPQAQAQAFAVWMDRTHRFDAAYLDLCQAGLVQEFWDEVARQRPNGTCR